MMKKALNGNLRIAAIAAAVFAALILACSTFTADRAYAEELPSFSDVSRGQAVTTDDLDFFDDCVSADLNDYVEVPVETLEKTFRFVTDSDDFAIDSLDWDCIDVTEQVDVYYTSNRSLQAGLYRFNIKMLYDSTASGDFTNATVISTVPVVVWVYEDTGTQEMRFIDGEGTELSGEIDLGELYEGYTQEEADARRKTFLVKNTGTMGFYVCDAGLYPDGTDYRAFETFMYDDSDLEHLTYLAPNDTIETKWIAPTVGQEAGTYSVDLTFCDPLTDNETQTITVKYTVLAHLHALTEIDEVAPTCVKEGVKSHYKCEECGGLFVKDGSDYKPVTEEELKIPIDPNAHKMTEVTEKPATCCEAGWKAHYFCEDCENAYLDAAGTTPASKEELALPIDPDAHAWDAGTITKKATAKAAGEKKFTCKHDPEHVRTVVIPKLKSPVYDIKRLVIRKPLKKGKKRILVRWRKPAKAVLKKIGKIQVQYSLTRKFKKGKTVTKNVKKGNVKLLLKKLKSKKYYYVRVRGYRKTSNGVVHLSKWSKVKKIRVK